MIIVVGGIKGGSGKTTVATNLAVLRSGKSKDVLLIDADDQETATDFTILRNEQLPKGAGYTSIKLSGSAVRTEVLRLSDKFKDIIIDTGGRDTTSQRAALSVADILLIPFVPRSFDVWTLEKVSALVGEMKTVNPNLKAFAFINRADPRGQDNDEASEVIRENEEITFINTPLGARKAFSNAASAGLAVTEVKPLDQKAADEMQVLYKYVFNTRMKSVSKGE
jgi:chromosome partitioning protein